MVDSKHMVTLQLPEEAMTPQTLRALERDLLPTLPEQIRTNVESQIRNQLPGAWPIASTDGDGREPVSRTTSR